MKILVKALLILFIILIFACDRDMHREKVVGVVKQVHDKILAKVNGIPITLSDFEKEKNNLPPHLRELLKDKEKEKQFLDNLITKELLYQEAEKLKIANRKNIQEMLRNYKKNLLINELIRIQIKNNVSITDKDAYNYYLKHKKQFYNYEKFYFQKYIFKDFTDAKNFLKNYTLSKCVNSCTKKVISKKSNEIINPDILATLQSLHIGSYSNILWTKEGYVILKLTKKSQKKLKPFYKVKDEIFQILKEEKEKKLLQKYINTLKSNANIVVFYRDNNTIQ